jgi:hypothetical protein
MRGGVKQTQRRLGRQRSGRTPIAVAMSSGLAGFLLGAGFWIYLGAREAAEREMPLSWDAPQSGCTSLALDRQKGSTSATPCLGPSQSLRDTLTAWLGERLLR